MFERLGKLVSRTWGALLPGWIALYVVLSLVAPNWYDVIDDGEFSFLPKDYPSRQAEELFTRTFSTEFRGTSIVIVAQRNTEDGLRDEDKTYLEESFIPRLKTLVEFNSAASSSEVKTDAAGPAKSPLDRSKDLADAAIRADDPGGYFKPVVARVRTFADPEFGKLLQSDDNRAALVVLELTNDFTDLWNEPTVHRIEGLIGRPGQPGRVEREADFPQGLKLLLSGNATVGRDMRVAGAESAQATEHATLLLVILLLFGIYRAPILAVIPLITVYISVRIALLTLSLLARAHLVRLFTGIEVYVTVVLYGAGVDYCMFLMARYKEELDRGATFGEAIAIAVGRVGHALAASAATVMCGIGMMVFTQFGKFQDAGIAMSFSLVFVLAAALTLTPALLRLAGRWTFWPRVPSERLAADQGWVSPTNAVARMLEREWFGAFWDRIGAALLARPGRIWLGTVALMLPFAVVAVLCRHQLSYGLLSELPATDPSVAGAAALQSHFPAGLPGPITILVANREADFRVDGGGDSGDNRPGWEQIQEFSDNLSENREKLGIVDVRSIAYPLGMSERVQTDPFRRRVLRKRAQSEYVSDKPGWEGKVTWIDVILDNDPFSADSMSKFDRLREAAPGLLPPSLNHAALKNADLKNVTPENTAVKDAPPRNSGTDLEFLGPTASIRDLKRVTAGDQTKIDFLVPGVVFLILVILLRRVATSAYLIVTVLFSYYVTLGLTFAVFYALHPGGFNGLDWKVPMFLFTILVAVGEDYNILLMARIEEEQATYGPVKGILVGLRKTGAIISSCGLIMAGTFSSLLFGSLYGLAQLGFALAAGVLVDTFVVRPIIVPAYLILLHQGRFGAVGRFLGAQPKPQTEDLPPVAVQR